MDSIIDDVTPAPQIMHDNGPHYVRSHNSCPDHMNLTARVITLNTRFEDYTRNTSKSIDTMNSSINGLSSEIEALKINEGRKDQRLVGIEGKLEKQGETLEKVHEKLNNLAIKIATGVGAGGGLVYAIVEAIKAWKA
jgi:hypothetical protein